MKIILWGMFGLSWLTLPAQSQRNSATLLSDWDITGWPTSAWQTTGPANQRETLRGGRLPVALGSPFIACSAGWDDANAAEGNTLLSVAWSADSAVWSDWTDLRADPHAIGTKKQFTTELLFLPSEARWYRVKIATNRKGAGSLRSLLLNFFSPGTAPMPAAPADRLPAGADACPCDKPTVVSRSGWNCPQTNNPGYGYTTVTHLIVHHSAGANTSSDWAAVVLSIWNSHVNTNGWADVGYNYLIDPNGRLYEGRGGGDNVTGAHFCGTNGGTMGTCLLGTYTSVSASDTARKMLTRLLAWKACNSNINPAASGFHASSNRTLNHISGHRDGCATECPGTMTYTELATLRQAVVNTINACQTATPVRYVEGLRSFRLAPNPASQGRATMQISLTSANRFSYEVMALDGKVLHRSGSTNLPAGRTDMEIRGLDKIRTGSLLIHVRLGRQTFTERLQLGKE